MISHGPSIRSVRNSQLIQPTTGLRHFASQLKASREIYIRSCVTKSTGLPQRRSGTPFTTPQARQIEVEIRYDNQQFRLRVRDDGKGIDPVSSVGTGALRDTMVCPACGNAPN